MKKIPLWLMSMLFLSGCTAGPRTELKAEEIEFLAQTRCLSKLNIWPREILISMGEKRVKDYQSESEALKYVMSHGLSAEQNQKVLQNSLMRDCQNTVLTHLAVDFPPDRAATFTTILMAEGWFVKNPGIGRNGRLVTNLYDLCLGKYKKVCSP